MTDATVARILGALLAVGGIVGGGISWSNGWTLFVPFAVVLVVLGVWLELVGWSERHLSD